MADGAHDHPFLDTSDPTQSVPRLLWQDAAAEIHQVVVGGMDNNVYIVRCRDTGEAVLIDAANEHDLLLELSAQLGVTSVLETHGHWDHIGAVAAMRSAGYSVGVAAEDASMLPSYDDVIEPESVRTVGRLQIRSIHTPGHTPGSVSFEVIGLPVLFTGDTLFPGGPGATKFEGGDFPTIIESIENEMFRRFDKDTLVLPGHGRWTTIGAESPSLDEWVARGW